jgi:hypothetical protein
MTDQAVGAGTESLVVASAVPAPAGGVALEPGDGLPMLTAARMGLTMLGSADDGATCADGLCAVPETLAGG